MDSICFNCFRNTSGYQVCPYCGHVVGTPNTPAYMLQPGMRIWGRYVIGSILGIGGFGVTYKAFDTRLSSVVAIKEFFPQNMASRMPGETELRGFSGEHFKNYQIYKQRFVEEGKNLAKFTGDEHIVNVLGTFDDNNTAYIVMEHLDGMTLKEYMAQNDGAIPSQRAAEIMHDLLQGIKSIHLKGIIHRDISPDNIYICEGGNVKILDFGAARFAAKEEWTQSVVVKKGYAPPEQYRNNMRQSEQTDLYAAGATYYKMLTGVTPEESIERTEKDTLQRPSKLVSGIDAQVDKLIMKSMALRPELRFKSADDMLVALSGGTGYDYPEEELKRINFRRRGIIAVAVVMMLSVFGVMGWRAASGETVLPTIVRVDQTLADKNIQPDSITLWVAEHENEDGLYNTLATEFMAAYPEYEVVVEMQSWEQMDLVGEGVLEVEPDIIPQYLNDEQSADLTMLINGLNADDYYHTFNDYKYWAEEGEHINRVEVTFNVEYITLRPPLNEPDFYLPETIDSLESFARFDEQFAYRNIDTFFDVASLYLPDLIDYQDGTEMFMPEPWESHVRDYFEGYVQNEMAMEYEHYFDDSGAQSAYYDYAVAGTSQYNQVYLQEGTNTATEPIIIPVISVDEDVVYTYGYEDLGFSVNANSNENKQLVAMQFLHFMLSEKGQTIISVQHGRSLPMHKAAMVQKLQYNPELAALEPYFDNPLWNGSYIPYELTDQFYDAFQMELSIFAEKNYHDYINDYPGEPQSAQDMYDFLADEKQAIVDEAVRMFMEFEFEGYN